MKPYLLAAALTLLPAATPAFSQQAEPAPQSKKKLELLGDIESWRATQLPRLTPPADLTVRFEPRLDQIQAEAKEARADAELAKPRQELEAWKTELLNQQYAAARSAGRTRDSFADYSAEQILRAAFSAALAPLRAPAAAERAVAQTQRRSLSAVENPAAFFDGNGLRPAGTAAVAAAPPAGAKDPARYAKVREILVSQGKSPRIVDMAIREAIRQNADPLLVLAVIHQESGFHAYATSSCGARGLMQLMPGTGRGLGVKDSDMLYDAQTNLRAGIRYLQSQWSRFVGGSMTSIAGMNPLASHGVKSAVAAYNAGPGNVHKYGGVPPFRETQGYVKSVLGYYNRLKQSLDA